MHYLGKINAPKNSDTGHVVKTDREINHALFQMLLFMSVCLLFNKNSTYRARKNQNKTLVH